MTRSSSLLLGIGLVLVGPAGSMAQIKPETSDRGKKATAIVDAKGYGWSGTAVCVHKTGLFLTPLGVVRDAIEARHDVRLVIDVGLATQSTWKAKVLRHDDRLNLALIQVEQPMTPDEMKDDARNRASVLVKPGANPAFPSLELGTDDDLFELAEVATFGYPLIPEVHPNLVVFPAVTVRLNQITSLRKEKGRLLAVQVDSQLKPGQEGAPVLDASGKLIGLVAEMVPGAALNLAIPAGRLAEFLAAPGLSFEPLPLKESDRDHNLTWTIQVQPPLPGGKMPEGLSIFVILPESDKPRTFKAEPSGPTARTYQVSLTPLVGPPSRGVLFQASFNIPHITVELRGDDRELTIGARKIKMSELKVLYPDDRKDPYAETLDGKVIKGRVDGLGQVRVMPGVMGSLQLMWAEKISVERYDKPTPDFPVVVEARIGPKVVATIQRKVKVEFQSPHQIPR